MTRFSAIILAAGKGTRMKSALPKPLHKIAHKPMLQYVIEAYQNAGAVEIVIVISADDKITPSLFPDALFAIQTEQKGTGHAVMAGMKGLTQPVDKIAVAIGDQPFIDMATIRNMVAQPHAVTVVAMRPEDPARYGRLITDTSGFLLRIVECKDATERERKINLCNAYPICMDARYANDMVSQINCNNAAGEYYFTDVLEIANQMDLKCGFIETPVANAAAANTREELAYLENILQQKLRQKAMANGATLIDPQSVYFSHDTVTGCDVVIEPNVFFGPGVTIGDRVHIKAFSRIENCVIESDAVITPLTSAYL